METPDFDPSSELSEQLEALKSALAEAEDLCAEFAIEMYLEAKRVSGKGERCQPTMTI